MLTDDEVIELRDEQVLRSRLAEEWWIGCGCGVICTLIVVAATLWWVFS